MSWRSLDWKACAYRSARMSTSHGWKMPALCAQGVDAYAIRLYLLRSRIFSTSLHPWMKPTDHGHFLPLADLRCPIQCGQYGECSDSHPHTASGESYPEQWYDSASPTDGSVRWEAMFSWSMPCKEEEDQSNWLQALNYISQPNILI